MKRILSILTILIIFTFKIIGQNNYQIHFSSDYVFNKTEQGIYISNSGFDAGFDKIIPIFKNNLTLNLGIDAGINSVAFFSSLNASIEKGFTFNKFNNVYISFGTRQGLQFFKPNPLYLFDFYSRIEYSHNIFKDKKIGVFLELSYYNIPNYKFYSTINQFWGMNIGINYRF